MRVRTAAAVISVVSAILGVTACAGSPSTARAVAPTAAEPSELTAAPLNVPPALATAPFDTPRRVLLPPGATMSVWARVAGPRLAVWAPDGALLVSRPAAGQVVRLPGDRPAPTSPSVSPATSSVLLDGLDQPHGLAFDGGTLYVADSDRIIAYDYADGAATDPRTVAGGLPDARSPELGGAYAHALKSVAVGPDHALYFSIGSTGNISAADRDAVPQRATIMRIPPGGGTPAVFARGVRNGTGLAIAPDGAVWTAVNNRDNIGDPAADGAVTPGYVGDHPPEELARLRQGRDLGWPFCNPDQDPPASGVIPPNTDVNRSPRFAPDVQTNPTGARLDCATLPPIERTFGAHSAPLGLSFSTALPGPYQDGALVGIHGSWNRTPPRAPEVSYFPFSAGTLGPGRTLVGGFQAADGSRWGRPVAAVVGPDGAVYITDDSAGAVYRLVLPGR